MKLGFEEPFKELLQPTVEGIQNYGQRDQQKWTTAKIDEAYVEKDGRTYLNSNLMRAQMTGIHSNPGGGMKLLDSSATGATRNLAIDLPVYVANHKSTAGLKHLLAR